jgi:hypothetical protein
MNQLNNNIVYLESSDNSSKKRTYKQTDESNNILDGKIVLYKCRKYEIPKRHKYLISNRSKRKKKQ